MKNSIPKNKVKKQGETVKKIQGIEKRITQKDLAKLLFVSESTLYRYKTGKTKKPKTNIEALVSEIWDKTKHYKKSESVKEKQVFLTKIEQDYYYAKSVPFKSSRTINHIYRTSTLNHSLLEDIVSEMEHKFKTNFFSVSLVGIAEEMNEEGEMKNVEQAYSTHYVYTLADGVDELWNKVKALLAKPSKKLKSVKWFEIIAKEFLPKLGK